MFGTTLTAGSIRTLIRSLHTERYVLAAELLDEAAAALLAIAAVFMLAGAARGEVDVLFRKATNICMECIGLG